MSAPSKKGIKKSTKKFQKNQLETSIKNRRIAQKFKRRDAAKEEKRSQRIEAAKESGDIEDDVKKTDAAKGEKQQKKAAAKRSTDATAGTAVDGDEADRSRIEDLSFDAFVSSKMLDDDDDAGDDGDDDNNDDAEENGKPVKSKGKPKKISGDGIDLDFDAIEKDILAGLEKDDDSGDSKSSSSSASSSTPKLAYAIGDDTEKDGNDAHDIGGDDEDDGNIENDIKVMNETLKSMHERDPEFYEHLQKSDKGLLEFADTSADAPNEDDVDAAVEAAQAASKKKQPQAKKGVKQENTDDATVKPEPSESDDTATLQQKKKRLTRTQKEKLATARLAEGGGLTTATLKALSRHIMERRSLTALKRMLLLYRKGCHLGDDEKTEDSKNPLTHRKTFTDIMHFCFKNAATIFDMHLNRTAPLPSATASASGSMMMGYDHKNVKSFEGWDRIAPLVRSYLGNTMHALNRTIQPKMLSLILQSLEPVIPYFEPFPKLSAKFLKVLLRLWGTSDHRTRIESFLRIRELCLWMPDSHRILETSLKGVYLTYVRNAKFVSQQTLPVINFMSNCVVELYGLDDVSSYQHAFVYVRQLAIHLRNAIIHKTKDSHKTVYNWQYINCLRVWSRVLAAHASSPDSRLAPLIYPYCQIAILVLELLPVARYFPLRLHVISFLNYLCDRTHVYVPVSTHLTSIIQSPQWNRKIKENVKGGVKAYNLRYVLKVSQSVLGLKEYQDGVIADSLSLLAEHFTTFSYAIAFPELILAAKVTARKFLKKNGQTRFRKQITSLIERLDANSEWITKKRNATSFAPKDLATRGLSAVTTFKPDTSSSSSSSSFSGKSSKQSGAATELSPLAKHAALRPPGSSGIGSGLGVDPSSSSSSSSSNNEDKNAVWESSKQKPVRDDSDEEDDDTAAAEGEANGGDEDLDDLSSEDDDDEDDVGGGDHKQRKRKPKSENNHSSANKRIKSEPNSDAVNAANALINEADAAGGGDTVDEFVLSDDENDGDAAAAAAAGKSKKPSAKPKASSTSSSAKAGKKSRR